MGEECEESVLGADGLGGAVTSSVATFVYVRNVQSLKLSAIYTSNILLAFCVSKS